MTAKGQEQQTQTQTTRPPDYAIPFIGQGLNNASGLLQAGGPQQYTGATVVPFSDPTNQALNLTQNRALSGSGTVDAAKSFTQNLLQGNSPLTQNFTGGPTGENFLTPFTGGSNPYLDATFDKAAGAVGRQLDTTLARSGRDLDANLGVRSDALNNLATSIYGGAYESDRNRGLSAASQLSNQTFGGGQADLNRNLQAASTLGSQQLNAVGNAIPLANQDYFDIGQLRGVGAEVENLAGRYQQDAKSRFDYEQQRPEAQLDAFLGRLSGNYGQTIQSPIYRNRAAGALGGAASGAAVGTQIMPGWGTAIGALAGGLLGAQ